jgi:glutathione S-transferase
MLGHRPQDGGSHFPAPARCTGVRLYDYAASANCYKVRLLLEQLEIPYEKVSLDIFDGDTLTDAFARMNPAKTTPVLELGPGRHLTESNAILAYLAEGTDLLPDDRFERAQVLRWLLFEQADVIPTMGGLRFRLLTGRLSSADPEAVRRKAGAEDALGVLDAHLTNRSFLAADRYTVADIAIYAYTHVAHEAGVDTSPYPAFGAWLARVEAQPRHMNDLQPYPANASVQNGLSVYG